MMKLCRNAHQFFGKFITEDGIVDFKYFELLVEIQEKMNFKFGNKLTKGHVQFKDDKMRTKLAVQLYSQSTAKSLIFMKKLGVPEFQDVDATVKFCEIFDGVFDLLNSRSSNALENRRTISIDNYINALGRIEIYVKYIQAIEVEYIQLKTGKHVRCRIVNHPNRETGFVGLLLDLETLRGLIQEMVSEKQQNFPLSIPSIMPNEIVPYFYCQDHLEQLFSTHF
jgi:hypothetical protein